LHILRPFSFLLNKFWSPDQQVKIIGFEPPDFDLPPNYEFVSLGPQRGLKYWTNDHIDYFQGIEDQYFVHMLENEFFLKPLDTEIYADVVSRLSPEVGRVDLTPGPSQRSNNLVENRGRYDIIELTQDASYRLALRFNIWNKDYLMKYLIPGEDCWEYEVKGIERSKDDGYQIMATDRSYVMHIMDGVAMTGGKRPNILDLRARLHPERSSFQLPLDEGSIREMVDCNIITPKGQYYEVAL
jgi:hypothetical protein